MNADPSQRSARYLADSTGAPPVPPPGGYAGAMRPRGADQALSATRGETVHVELDRPARRRSVLGWTAIAVASVFAVALFVLLMAGAVDTVYSLTFVAVQLVVLGIAIAATILPSARLLGAIALSITLLFNVGTVGALTSSQSAATGGYEGHKSDADRLWEAYPGIKDVSPDELLGQPTLEEVRARSEALSERIRQALSERFGYTWVRSGDEDVSPVRNGYGGESLATSYMSTSWMTEQPVHSLDERYAAMDVIDDVISSEAMAPLYALNAPQSGLDPAVLAKLYGSDDVATQSVWEWYSYHVDGVTRMYANVFDLGHDDSGSFTRAREAAAAQTGEPLEGIELAFMADHVISDADLDEFRESLEKYS